jgi:hypothetical protein
MKRDHSEPSAPRSQKESIKSKLVTATPGAVAKDEGAELRRKAAVRRQKTHSKR